MTLLEKTAVENNWLERIKAKDVSLWSQDVEVQEKVANRLGWLDSIFWLPETLESIYALKAELCADNINHVVLLGMGGSSLAPEVCRIIDQNITQNSSSLSSEDNCNALTFEMLDDTSPAAVRAIVDNIVLAETVFLVSSKSGSTIETDAFFRYFYQLYDSETAGNHFIAITDPGTMMESAASEYNFRHAFINPSDIGGRFSALSYFGIVPAVFMGIDVDAMIAGAKQEYKDVFESNIINNDAGPVALQVGLQMAAWALEGRNKCFLCFGDEVSVMQLWIDQLIAESTGKQSQGILPVPTLPSFTLTQDAFWMKVDYQTDNAVSNKLTIDQDSKTIAWQVSGWHDIGRDFLRWEIITAVIGVALKINPFDEPDVTFAKEKTNDILANPALMAKLDVFKINDLVAINTLLKETLATIDSPYISIALFGDNKDKVAKEITAWQAMLHNTYQVPVVANIGPRYLHSSGQLHKGGPAQGAFIIITLGYGDDEVIPHKGFDFAQLNKSQALGDMTALNERGRPIIWLDMPNAETLKNLLKG